MSRIMSFRRRVNLFRGDEICGLLLFLNPAADQLARRHPRVGGLWNVLLFI